MKYFEEIDAWLSKLLREPGPEESDGEWVARVKTTIKDKLLESYRNGQKAGPRLESREGEGRESHSRFRRQPARQ
jgi:hypothetical protein